MSDHEADLPDLPGPATDVAQAEEHVAELRARLDRDVAVLEARLPPPEVLVARARRAGVIAGTGLAVLVTTGILLRRLRRRRARTRDLHIQAAELARLLEDFRGRRRG